MSDDEFLPHFIEAIGADNGAVTLDTPLSSIEVWDSIAYLNVMALVDEKMGVTLDPELMVAAETPRAILEQARKGVAP
jgi:acyl carrier protein